MISVNGHDHGYQLWNHNHGQVPLQEVLTFRFCGVDCAVRPYGPDCAVISLLCQRRRDGSASRPAGVSAVESERHGCFPRYPGTNETVARAESELRVIIRDVRSPGIRWRQVGAGASSPSRTGSNRFPADVGRDAPISVRDQTSFRPLRAAPAKRRRARRLMPSRSATSDRVSAPAARSRSMISASVPLAS